MADASFPVAIKYEVDEQQLQLEFFGTNKDSGKRDSTIVSLPLGVAEELGFRLQREARPLLTALLLAKKKDGDNSTLRLTTGLAATCTEPDSCGR